MKLLHLQQLAQLQQVQLQALLQHQLQQHKHQATLTQLAEVSQQLDPSFRASLNGGYFGQCTYYVFNRMAQVGTTNRSQHDG